MKRLQSLPIAAALLAALVTVPVHVWAAQAPAPAGQDDHQHAASPEAAGATGQMGQEMMARMKAEDAKLGALVQTMNGAKGDARDTAMAALLTELVQAHRMMGDQMQQMHDGMMGNMSSMMGNMMQMMMAGAMKGMAGQSAPGDQPPAK